MNHRECIVAEDLKELGYSVSRNKETGYPDFRVVHPVDDEQFYVEVKSSQNGLFSQIQYHNTQKDKFAELVRNGLLVLIAVPNDGVLRYKTFPDMSLWRESSYEDTEVDEPSGEGCKRCGHTWLPRVAKPVRCPKCQSPYWYKEKMRRNVK